MVLSGASFSLKIQHVSDGEFTELINVEENQDPEKNLIVKSSGKFGFSIIGPYYTKVARVKIEEI